MSETCPGCLERDAVIVTLLQRVQELEGRVRELEGRLGRNASNSSVPPSANPPSAPRPVAKEPTGRQPGGQPGHAPCQRLRLPAERVQTFVHHRPTSCQRCQTPLPEEPSPDDPPPTWH